MVNMLQLNLSLDDVNLVLLALGEQPLKVSVGVWSSIKAQADAQLNPPKPARKKKVPSE